jgi:hypothetical protein
VGTQPLFEVFSKQSPYLAICWPLLCSVVTLKTLVSHLETPPVELTFGIDHRTFVQEKKNTLITWDTRRVINPHILIVGKSGTGKTYNLRKMLRQLLAQSAPGKLRVHIFDVHGDIEIAGASSVKFSESTPYGFNPLWLNPDPDFGGVRKRIQSFIAALNRTSRSLGTKQESTLRNLLMDLYSANGFKDGQPATWLLNDGVTRKFPKKNPTLEDAHKFAMYKQKAMYIGGSTPAVEKLEELNRKQMSYYAKKRKALREGRAPDQDAAIEAEIQKLKDECLLKYTEYLNAVESGMEFDDLIRYDSRDVLKSVVERLENLNAVGIFKNKRPPFDDDCPMWRYDIKSLSMDEKKLFVSFRLEEIFYKALERGVQDDVRDVIVLDEAHNFFNDDESNITNVIAKEARKFGISLVCASQAATHFSDDFLSNVGTKIILGLDQMYWDSSMRKLKFDSGLMESVIPQKTLAIQINNKAETRTEFRLALITPD